MHREWVDRSAHAEGPLQRWDPRLKVGLTLATLLAIVFGARHPEPASWVRLAGVAAAGVLVARFAGIPLRSLGLRSLVVLPFVAFVAVARALEVVHGSADGIPLGSWTLRLAPDGLELGALIATRAWLSIGITLVLVLSTPLPSILAALERWHLPRGFLEACSLVYRYLWVLIDEGRKLLLARRLRGGSVGLWRSGGRILATLFVRSLDRAHRIELALRLRGYDGTLPIGHRLVWTPFDSRRLLVATLLLAAILVGSDFIGAELAVGGALRE